MDQAQRQERNLFMGLGYWTRANAELCLLATKGKPKRVDAGVRQVILTPIQQHNRKPDEAYDRIERLLDGPYVELFARRHRPRWDAWGLGAPTAEAAE